MDERALQNPEDHGAVQQLVAELAQLARLVAVGDEHRHELARLSGLVEGIAGALDEARAERSLPAALDQRLDALQSSVTEAAQAAAAAAQRPDGGSEDADEVRRLSAEMAEMARLVALTDADRRRLSELHRIASAGDAVSVSRQIEALHRDIRRLMGADPELANPAWHRDRVARRQAEADVIRLEHELAELGQQFVQQRLELEETRKSRRKLKASVDKLRRHADALGQRHAAQKRELDQLRKSYRKLRTALDTPPGLRGKARHWARTASMAQPLRWAYQRLRGGA